MYAIVDIAGQQFKVEKDQKLFVHRLEGEAGSKVSIDKVLLIDNENKVTLGNPVIKGAAVSARIIEHLKGEKVLVFKKKRKKGYQKLNGHRQYFTSILIEDIIEKGAKPAEEQKAAAAPKAKIAETPATEVKTEVKAETKAEAPVKAAPKKTAAPKAETEKKPATAKKTTTAKKPAAAKAAPKTGTTASKPAAKKAAPKKSDDKKAAE